MGCNANSIYFVSQFVTMVLDKMNIQLCRICGCEVKDLAKCNKCSLVISTICNCCANIEQIQIHTHE